MTLSVSPPPIRTIMTDQQGVINKIWSVFLRDVHAKLADIDVNSKALETLDAAALAQSVQDALQSITDSLTALNTLQDSVTQSAATIASTADAFNAQNRAVSSNTRAIEANESRISVNLNLINKNTLGIDSDTSGFTYNDEGLLIRIDYDGSNFKTFTYVEGRLTAVTFSRAGATSVKTINYSADNSVISVVRS